MTDQAGFFFDTRSPRHYAANFMKAGDDKQRQKQALSGCPKEWQELVKTHIKIRRERGK